MLGGVSNYGSGNKNRPLELSSFQGAYPKGLLVIEDHNSILRTKNNPLKDRETKIVSDEMQQDFDELNPPPFDDEYNRQYLNEEFIEPTNVIQLPIAEEVQTKKNDKPTAHQIEERLCKWLDKHGAFSVWRPEVGEPQIIRHWPSVVTTAQNENVAAFLAENMTKMPKYMHLSFKRCEQVAKRWRYCTMKELAEWPRPVGFKSEKGLFFSRLSFDPAPQASLADFPVIAEILSRMNVPDRFCQMLGSAFVPDSIRKQVLWLYGEGNSGKSFLLNNVISKLLGGKTGTATFSGEALSGAHWKEPLIGKSLLVVNEASSSFIRKDAFKSLTGDDLHMINPKGLKMFQGKLDCRVFFSSNEDPEVPNDQAIKDRLIVCKITAFMGKKLSPVLLEKKVEGELAAFVRYCIDLYSQLDGNPIPTESEDLDDAIDSFEAQLQFTFDRCFVYDVTSAITAYDFMLHLEPHLNSKLGINLKSMRNFIKSRYGIQPGKLTKVKGNVQRLYNGLRLKLLNY